LRRREASLHTIGNEALTRTEENAAERGRDTLDDDVAM
jgi:hypothetical protein